MTAPKPSRKRVDITEPVRGGAHRVPAPGSSWGADRVPVAALLADIAPDVADATLADTTLDVPPDLRTPPRFQREVNADDPDEGIPAHRGFALDEISAAELVELAGRLREVVGVMTGRALVDDRAEHGYGLRDRAVQATAITVPSPGGGDVSVSVLDLSVLAELAAATAEAVVLTQVSGRAERVVHVVPDTMRQTGRGEHVGGRSVSGCWVPTVGELNT